MKQIVWIIFVTVALFGCTKDKETKSAAPDTAAGRALAKSSCIGCHGLDGKGVNDDIPHLAAQFDRYLVAALHAYKEGKRSHAALRDMTAAMNDADIRNVAGFYASLTPVKFDAVSDTKDIYQRGKESASVCSVCHGENGNSEKAGIPSLAGQQPSYLIASMRAYLEGKRVSSTKEKSNMVKALNDIDIETIAFYYASQAPKARASSESGDSSAGEPLTANCGECHGARGVSHNIAIPSLASQDAQYLINTINDFKSGKRNQPEMHTFLHNRNDTDIANIAAYYSIQESRASEEGSISIKELAEKCDRCHGPGMENPMMIFPKIRGQNKGYLIKALNAYREGTRGSSPMHKMSLPYSDAIIDGIATWYANQVAR